MKISVSISLSTSFLIILSKSASAVVMTTAPQTFETVEYNTNVYYDRYEVGNGPFYGGDGETVTGFKKFDASLGTLQEVKFTYEISGYIDIFAYAYGFDTDAPSSGGSFDFEFSALDSYVVPVVIYSPSDHPLGYGYTGVSGGAAFSPLGVIGEPVDNYLFEDEFGNEFDYFEEVFFDPIGPEIAMNSVLVTDPNFNLSDFAGDPNDDVVILETLLYVEIAETDLSISGIGNSNFEFSFEVYLDPGTITLEYVYDDSIGAIPEPAAASALLGLIALGGLSLRRRR